MNRHYQSSPASDLESYQLLVASVKDYAIFMLDPAGHIASWNKGAAHIKGYTATEIIGQHFSRFYLPEDIAAGKPDRALQTAEREGKYEEEGWRLRKDGNRFWAHVVITPLYDQSGKLAGFAKVTRDLTERKRHEEALRLANDQLQALVEERTAELFQEKQRAQATLRSTGDAVVTVTDSGTIEYLNPVAEQLTGWTTMEAKGYAIQDILKIVDADTRLPVRNPVEQALQENRIVELANNALLLARDGRELHIEDSAAPIHAEDGALIGAVMVFHDVSRRKLAEKALRRSEQNYRITFEHAPLGLCHVALDGAVIKANQAIADMFGYSIDELYQLKPQDVIHPDDLAEDVEGAKRLLSGELDVFQREKRHIRKDGSLCWSKAYSSLIRDEAGKPQYFIAAIEDITERIQTEHALRDSMQQFATTFDLAPIGIVHTALDGRLLQVNQAFCQMTGYTKEELADLPFAAISHPDDAEIQSSTMQQLLSGQVEKMDLDKRYIRKDGLEIWAHVTGTLKRNTDTGTPEYFLGIIEDVTERKRTEAALREREQQFRATFEQAAVGVGHVSLDGRWLRVNQKFCDILGYTRDELLQLTYQDITHPDDQQVGPKYLRRLAKGEASTELIQKRYRRKDGSIAWVEIAASPVRNETGELQYISTFIEDITERTLSDQALRASEERYRATVENAPVGIAQTDLNGCWQQVNDRLCQILGYSREELLRMSFKDITPASDYKAQQVWARKIFDGEIDTFTMEKRYRRPDNATVWANLTGTLIRDGDGKPAYFITVVEDITARKQAEEALQASEEQFRAIFEHAAEGIAQVNLAGRWLRANKALCRIVGYSEPEMRKLSFQEITYPADLATELEQFRQLLAGEISDYSLEKRYIRKNRTRVWVDLTASLVRGLDGQPKYVIAMVEDITRRKQAEETIRRAEAHFRSLVEGTEDYAIVRLDSYGNVSSWNPGAEKILGYSEDEIIGQHFSIFYTPEDVERGEPQRKLSRAIREGRAEEDRWRTRKDGSRFWGAGVINALYDEDGNVQGFVKFIRDMTEQRLGQERTAYLANHDTLTGLPNRAYFSDRLHEAIANAERHAARFALLLLDLDRFKSINDSLGHHIGDLLLKEVAARLQTCMRETDTVARLGGDEFVVIQTNISADRDAATLAQKLVNTLEEPYLLEGQEVHSGTSIGVTIYPNDARDSVQLLKNADLALYQAKDTGRHHYQFFTEDMHTAILGRQQMEQDLRRALQNKEFSLFYQPQVDLATWQICGVEALLRWQNPQLQMLTPGMFLELAMETGLIIPIGEWVLREACRQNKAWQDAGLPAFRIGVNFCAKQVTDPRFIRMVHQVLSDTGLSPSCLEMEITENQFVKDREIMQRILADLKAMDVRISTDDFGTALSSLNLLCQFPMDTLKIDRTVIEHVAHRKQDRAMAAAVINLARDLNVRVVAEGVETLEQLAFLQQQGCTSAQGFLFSPPVSAPALEALLRDGNWSRMNPAHGQD
jgi:diguanylate cyclase (GGDEF)-like protein/PAS domain S-box-containing protein